MQALLTNLTAFSLCIHALIGCCWHHAHGATCHAESTVVSKSSASPKCAGCCHHCRHVSDDTPADHQRDGDHSAPRAPCNCKVECHGVCTYLPPEKQQLDNLADAPAFDLPVLMIDQGYAVIGPAGYCQWLADSGPTIAPARLHLLHQVFLI